MPMLRRGYGAVKNLRCKSGARFPPSTEVCYHHKGNVPFAIYAHHGNMCSTKFLDSGPDNLSEACSFIRTQPQP